METIKAEVLAALGAENPSELLGAFFDMDTDQLVGGMEGIAMMQVEGVRPHPCSSLFTYPC